MSYTLGERAIHKDRGHLGLKGSGLVAVRVVISYTAGHLKSFEAEQMLHFS